MDNAGESLAKDYMVMYVIGAEDRAHLKLLFDACCKLVSGTCCGFPDSVLVDYFSPHSVV